jgi:hypothetical protein
MSGHCGKRRYTIIGYLDLHEIHPVFEHVTGCHAKCAVYRFKLKLRKEHSEYRKVMEEYEPLTVIAVFRGHQKGVGNAPGKPKQTARAKL